MFHPETEDMLPRSAPKPSVPLDINTATIGRPIVPEVSILIGAKPAEMAFASTSRTTTSETAPQQTYAAWKKQVLPKVSFPPAGAEVYSINGHVLSSGGATETLPVSSGNAFANTQITSNLYPLRPLSANVPPTPTSVSSPVSGVMTAMQQYRQSLEQALCPQENSQRRSLDGYTTTVRAFQTSRDVLTICAGTQTDVTVHSNSTNNDATSHLATKQDLQQLLTILEEMRMEQVRLVNVVESVLVHHKSATQQNASTQCNDLDCGTPKEKPSDLPIAAGSSGRYRPTKEPFYMLESPRRPVAQSTAYQAPTPRNTVPHNKLSTEKSMIMNELAMKYLPSEQLNELLQELNISPKVPQQKAAPLRPVENIVKGSSDISNASYKYLKKYRLLPEEADEVKEQLASAPSPLAHSARQQEQRSASPRINSNKSPILDIEHIRRQPKLI